MSAARASGKGRRLRPWAIWLGMFLAACVLVLLFLSFAGIQCGYQPETEAPPPTAGSHGDAAFATAYEERRSDVQISGAGTVVRLLADDDEGSRHQRFIVALASGQTLLVAHNIDVAPRVAGLQEGDAVEFSGVYEWNEEGGVVHWTHHDPDGTHQDGWIKHEGQVYD